MWVECVPNFSEGQRADVIHDLWEASQVSGVRTLGISADPDHHRSVLTLAGEGEAVVDAAFRAARVAVERIDLRSHRGTHPRIGAVDVIPFIPLADTPMSYCVELACNLGERLARELHLPVLLYGRAARRPDRVNLADLRRGEFEGLSRRLALPEEDPDFGPKTPHPSAGAVAVGARPALIAFNAYLNTKDLHVAEQVARAVRGSSGGLAGVKALAMDIRTPGVQVSMNLVDYRRTPIAAALDMVRREAARYGVTVSATEIVGFVPLGAVLAAARYYLQAHQLGTEQVLELALLDAPLLEPRGWDAGWDNGSDLTED